jgi:hypothetical protein
MDSEPWGKRKMPLEFESLSHGRIAFGFFNIETDTPVSYQGKESRPTNVMISLAEVARLKELDPIVVAKQTTTNATHFFQIR